MKVHISRAFKGSKHIGWKKTVGGRVWFLGYGTPGRRSKGHGSCHRA